MKKVLFLIASGLLLAACRFQTQTTLTPATTGAPTATTTAAVSPTGGVMTKAVTLYEQNNSGESGTATFEEQGAKVKVTLRMAGAPNGIAQPAHIHVGKCPTPGAVKYPLTNVVKGESVTVLDMTLSQLLAQGDLAVNVHKSAQESSFYVACGDLK